jgi:hypothetical protein
VVSSLLAAAAGDLAVVRHRQAQQPLHGHCSGVMHRVPHQQLDSLQVDGAALMPIAEDDLYDSAYFLGDFLLDRFCRFFPAAKASPPPAVSDKSVRSPPQRTGSTAETDGKPRLRLRPSYARQGWRSSRSRFSHLLRK